MQRSRVLGHVDVAYAAALGAPCAIDTMSLSTRGEL